MKKTIVVASDKGGFPLKEVVKLHLLNQGFSVLDKGTLDPNEPVFFFQAASNAIEEINMQNAEMAILCCNTGMGMSQVANKYPGIFAAVCESTYTARKAREVNDSNVLCMGTWVVGPGLAEEITDTFINTKFTDGLPQERKEYLQQLKQNVRQLDRELRK